MGLALYSVAQLRALEQSAQRELAPGTLMQRAGMAAARAIGRRIGNARRIVVVCGAGNNGGDGYVTASELARRGHAVVCWALAPPATEDARAAAAAWRAGGGTVVVSLDAAQRVDVVVDAMLGIGLTRPLADTYLAAAQWMRTLPARSVFALDVPSGLDADRGSWVGGVPGVHAGTTITFLGAKPGLFTAAGCDAAGEVVVDTLGLQPSPAQCWRSDPTDFAGVCQPRRRDTHKGTFGTLGVLGGNVGMVGAALLAARAGLRLGAGRVVVECIGARELQLDWACPELMLRGLDLEALSALVAGCGLGSDPPARAALARTLAFPRPLLLDADALNLLAANADLLAALKTRTAPTVLTPHPLEAARLLAVSVRDVQQDRLHAAKALSQASGSFVVLKGAGSVIAAPDGRAWINPTGGPALATAGSGDVLAGMIGALLAQGYDVREATLAGVWLHGAAAEIHGGDCGLAASEIAALAAQRLQQLRRAASAR
ncbi:MAG: NAD(P)H-hydrate dehydratase [Sutterellaceae bacterium]|nr:NAD(P)H-hydrate dehydratase [Burkholderiaceae bacterium]MDW8429503.1 NAD(P)H-hydrate dehydratase [Sutterellaceae bacterium]